MHSLLVVLIPFDPRRAPVRPLVARDAAARAQIDTLLFRYEQPEEQMWGVDYMRGFRIDWWQIGGRWAGWGRQVRRLMAKQLVRPLERPIPRFLEPHAVWTDDLSRARLTSFPDYPLAVVTPYGDWIEGASALPIFGKPTIRQRKALAAWLRKIRKIMRVNPGCLAVGIDYHF
jgi:hypothetical protein